MPILRSDTIPQDQIGAIFWLRSPGWIIPIVLAILIQVFDAFAAHLSIVDTSTMLCLFLLAVAGALGLAGMLLMKQEKERAEWLFKGATAVGSFALGLEVGGRFQAKDKSAAATKKKATKTDTTKTS